MDREEFAAQMAHLDKVLLHERRWSLSGVASIAMLCFTMLSGMAAMVGGWYTFSYRMEQEEKRTTVLEDEHAADNASIERLNLTLDRTNAVLYGVEQALEDNHIHVVPNQNQNQ